MSECSSFFSKLEARIAQVESHLCVGLDPHMKELFPDGDGHTKTEEERCDRAFEFCKRIIDATGKLYSYQETLSGRVTEKIKIGIAQ
jgi:orotidine-5'-phosphate decarboxylase